MSQPEGQFIGASAGWRLKHFLQSAAVLRRKLEGREVAVQSLRHVRLFVTPYTAARQASLSSTISQSFLKVTSIESMMPSNHLILCRSLLLLPSVFLSIKFFTSELALHIK